VTTALPAVSAQVELLPSGVLNFTLVRTAPSGGSLTSTSGYNIRLSGTGLKSLVFPISPAISSTDTTITRSMILADITGNTSYTVTTTGLSINIQAVSGDTNFTNGPWWPTDRPFPTQFSLLVSNSNPSVGDSVTFALPNGYGTSNLTKIRLTPDITDTSIFTDWKSFYTGITFDHTYLTSGSFTAQAQISADIQNSSAGSSFLISDAIISLKVSAVQASDTGVNSWIGQTGFSFTDPSTSNYTAGNFSVILTGAAISTSHQELKMFLATSRSSDANTYYQTIAWDLFPVPGRYKIPSFAPCVNLSFDMTRAYSDASLYAPLKIVPMSLPEFQVGYYYELQVACSGGLKPYAYYAVDLPPGLFLTSQGRITGTPLQSGLFQASISVVDSEYPPQINVKTLNIYVKTDLALDPVPYQAYTVGEKVSQAITAVGGVPPYSWQVITGTTDLTNYGLSFVPGVNSSSIAGTVLDTGAELLPYTFPVKIQCIDAVGNAATVSFNCGISSSQLVILTTELKEFFDGEYAEQRIFAMGGDNTSYNWSLEYLSGPTDASGNLITPSQLIHITSSGLVGAENTAILSYTPYAVDRTVTGGSPEAFYRIRIIVTSGVSSYAQTASQDLDLVISPALADVVIENDSQLPIAYPSQGWTVNLKPLIPDSVNVPANRLGPISFATDSTWASSGADSYLTLTNTLVDGVVNGVLSLTDTTGASLPSNLNLWFRIILTAGRTVYFKDFHFMSATASAFSIHCEESYPLSDLSSNLVLVAQQYGSADILNRNGCAAFKVLNASIGQWVNLVAAFSVTDTTELPPGMSFSSLGFIYGTPTTLGVYSFTLVATVGTSTATYPATIVVNPASAYVSDLIHDVVISPNTPPAVAITYPIANELFKYGSVVNLSQLIQDASRPYTDNTDTTLSSEYNSSDIESYTYSWSFGGLPTVTDANGLTYREVVTSSLDQAVTETGATNPVTLDPGSVINQDTTSVGPKIVLLANARTPQKYIISVTVTDIMGDTGSATETITVNPAWFRTASASYEATKTKAPDESLTDGTLSIDLLGDWNASTGSWNS